MMHRAKQTLLVAGVLAVAGGVVLTMQRHVATELRDEVALLRTAQRREVARLQAQNQWLAAGQISAAELDKRRADHTAVMHLRGQIEELRARENASINSAPMKTVAADEAIPPEPPADVPATAWENAGRATPAATIETALWAAAGGDVDKLAEILSYNEEMGAKIEAALAGMPEELRLQYGTPEQFVALFAAKDLPVGGLQVIAPQGGSDPGEEQDSARMRVRYASADGSTKETTLDFMRTPADGWILVVPSSAVNRYIRMATGSASQLQRTEK